MVRRRDTTGAGTRRASSPPSGRPLGGPLLELLPVPLAIIDEEHVLWANASMQTLLGYSDRESLVGLPLTTLVLPGRSAQEERWMRADGTPVSVEVNRTMLEQGTLVVAREMLRSDRFAAQLLADRLAPAGTLAAGIAHQINNPLAYVLANLSFLEDELPKLIDDVRRGRVSDAEIEKQKQEMLNSLDDARHGAERVASIVRDLKLLSHLDDESVEDVDPRAMLDSAYNVVQAQVQSRARVIKDYHDVPRVLANEARLVQVFVDLLLNAAQAIPEGRSDRADVTLSTSADASGWACITVSDTGSGIPPEVLPKIFDPFFTTKAVGEGTGLGLTVCHGIITALGGRIHVESEVGRGTTVRIVLPPTDYTRKIATTTLPAQPLSANHLRILVVDDEINLVQAMRRNLAEYDVVATTSPNEALDRLLGGEWFDVVLCDVVMPETSGIDLFERVRAERPEQAERFVFMTGGAFTQRMRALLDEIENLQLDKPFSLARLKEVLDGVHPRSEPGGRTLPPSSGRK